MIGEEKDKKLKKYITIEFKPCLSNCYAHDFGIPAFAPLMPFEINPSNPLNANPMFFPLPDYYFYQTFMHELFLNYVMALVYVDTAIDLNNFEKPVTRTIGITEEVQYNLRKELTINFSFEQVVIRTYEGFFRRPMKEERKMGFK